MNPAGRVRCDMWTKIELANHSCNFTGSESAFFVSVVSVMVRWGEGGASWQSRPPVRVPGGRALTRSAYLRDLCLAIVSGRVRPLDVFLNRS